MDKEFYLKFPCVLKSALLKGEVAFDEAHTLIEYSKIDVYRGITREKDDNSEISKDDFLSYAELGRKPARGRKADIGWYSCSFYTEKDELELALKLPRFNKKISKGFIKKENGPIRKSEKDSHIHCWLYEDSDVEKAFKVV